MKQKIHVTLTLIALFAIMASTITVTLVSYNLFENQVIADLRINAELLKDTDVFDGKPADVHISDDQFTQVTSDKLRITWVDTDGTVLYDNDTDPSTLENHRNRPEIRDAFENGSGESVRTSDTFKLNTYYYALKLDNGTVLRVAMEAKNISSVFMAALPTIALIALAILIVCMIIAHTLTKQILAPINQMAETIENDGEGQLGEPTYRELIPFSNKIRSQHENILMAAKSRQDFTANVSHELKTPLTAISGYAELIENHMVDEKQEEYFAKQIQDNASRLLSLINDIISLSELDHAELEREFTATDIYELAALCCKEMEVNGSQRGITIHCSGESVTRRVDYNLIKEMLINLLQNGITYNKDPGFVNINVKASGECAVITVQDDGIGIPPESLDRVFERFYRVDKSRSRERGGTGLGLALVKHIVQIHDGEIKVESQVGKGTTFTICI